MPILPRTREEWENVISNKLHIEFSEKNYADEIKKVADKNLENCASACLVKIIGESNIPNSHKTLLYEGFKIHIKNALENVFSIESIKAIENAIDYKEISRNLQEKEEQKELEYYKDIEFENN